MAFRSFAITAALVTAALANPFIPTTISSGCSDYLVALNSNTSFSACTAPFLSAFQQFSPGSNSTGSVSNAIESFCGSDEAGKCPQSVFTTQLALFYQACSAELTTDVNEIVQTTYDVLYAMSPLSQVLCSKDDNGNYCSTQLSNPSSDSIAQAQPQTQALLNQYVFTTLNDNGTSYYSLNTTTFHATNLVYLFLNASVSSSLFCSSCTRDIMTAYITFESNAPYGSGLSNSLLFANQIELYSSILTECGASFLSGAVQAAGGLSGGLLSGGARRVDGQELSTVMGAFLGIAALIAAYL